MARLMVAHDKKPDIAVELIYVDERTPGRARGWHGTCSRCGTDWSMHRWQLENAVQSGRRHVDVVHEGGN